MKIVDDPRGSSHGGGWGFWGALGGTAIINENYEKLYPTRYPSIIAHELGHAFYLKHHEPDGSLMGSMPYGSLGFLTDYEARILNKHHLFNDTHILNAPPEVKSDLQIKAVGKYFLTLELHVTSPVGLYHCQVHNQQDYIGSGSPTGKEDIIQVDVKRRHIQEGDSIIFTIMDINGNIKQLLLTIDQLPEPETPEKSNGNKNPDLDLPKDKNPNPNIPEENSKPVTIKEDTSKNVVYLNINLGKKTLPDEDGLKPFNSIKEYKNGWGWHAISDNRTNSGNPIIIRNTTFERGFALSPPNRPEISSLKYNLQGNSYIAFEGYIGITNDRDFEIDKPENRSCFVGGSSIFTFEIDGESVHKSKLLTAKDRYEEVKFYIPADAEVLKITIDSGPDSSWCDTAAVADPKLISNSQIRYSIKPKGKITTLWGKIK
ncbi:MAG: NPCBM/NEW2 domain-containing protein [Candidatus Poribacteria bacterium]|nr:NPCBM/NEW2 domain-containing protein [Candidatus Poribacteria bacterium]